MDQSNNWLANFKNIVVPFMDLETSKHSLDAATATGGRVHVLHALVPFASTYPLDYFSLDTQQDLKAQTFERVEKILKDAGYDVELYLRYGDPAHMIAQLCEEVKADLIVMESAQRKGVSRWLLGSVAEHLVRESPCPLLVLPKHH